MIDFRPLPVVPNQSYSLETQRSSSFNSRFVIDFAFDKIKRDRDLAQPRFVKTIFA
jgi:hypothetical protein